MKRLVFTFSLRDVQEASLRIKDWTKFGEFTSTNVYETEELDEDEIYDIREGFEAYPLLGLEYESKIVNV